MKKVIIFVMTALMALALTIMTYAYGWTSENGVWVYYDQSGNKVTNSWKSSSGEYYYLDGYGNMVTNSFIDDRYYVDSDGKMVTSKWRWMDDAWYYFDANGLMAQSARKQISGKYYYFGDDGKMLTGWIQVEDDWYYYDPSDGHMFTSRWAQLAPASDMVLNTDRISNYRGMYDTDSDTSTYWFYFQPSGRISRAEDGEDYKEYIIGSQRYAFDADGKMRVGWVRLDSSASPVISGYKYYNDDTAFGTYGAAHVGWLSAYPPIDSGTALGTEVVWYYFNSRGVPYYTENSSTNSEETLNANLKRISKNNKVNSYLFNEYGNPVYGLRRVTRNNGSEDTSMYFGTKEESCLQYGETKITEGDGTVSDYGFNSLGYGITGVYKGKLYYKGKLQKAKSPSSYAYIEVNNTVYLVDKSGNLKKSHNLSLYERYKEQGSTRQYELEYVSDASGKKIEGAGTGEILSPDEPIFLNTEI